MRETSERKERNQEVRLKKFDKQQLEKKKITITRTTLKHSKA